MSDRKNINKYYPPDFDPSKIKKSKKAKRTGPASWPTVRLMIPFSMKCLNCNEYISKSKKFNAKKETTAESYLGIEIIQFHYKCPKCYNDLIFKTDPKNGDFLCVSGCKKNFDRSASSKRQDEDMDMILQRLEEEDKLEQLAKETGKKTVSTNKGETAIEQLERRLIEQQREQAMIEEIDELQQKNKKLEKNKDKVNILLETEEEKDEREAREAFATHLKIPVPDIEIAYNEEDGQEGDDNGEKSESQDNDSLSIDDEKRPLNGVGLLGGYGSSSDDDDFESGPIKQVTLKRKNNNLGIGIKKKAKI